jgi:RNA polymerase sigma-54 factor
LRQQLSLLVMPEEVRDAADTIIGNLDDNGYLVAALDEIATYGEHSLDDTEKALEEIQALEPAGVGARDVRECLMLQVESRGGVGGVAWQILDKHMKLLEMKQWKELGRVLGRPLEHIEIAIDMIRHLDPKPGLRYSGAGARVVEPDVYIIKDSDNYIIELNDDDLPQLRLNREYLKMLDREKEPDKDVRNYVKERFSSAAMLIKNIEQRKHTIMRVCQCVVDRQKEFLDLGIQQLRPMMIKEVAEEIGVHASTVSRAVAGKYVHTPQGVFELRFFFSEAVQGPSGSSTPLLVLKQKVKKIIDEEDPKKPLTDEQITARLQQEGFEVTRRTVAKYREDLKIPSTHQRRVKN